MEAEDVFDSVTWETPSATNGYDTGYTENTEEEPVTPGKPGFMHHNDEGSAPNEPKWEGYLIGVVKDPVKELDGTKDMYVSYLVAAKVRLKPSALLVKLIYDVRVDQSTYLLKHNTPSTQTFPRLCLSSRALGKRLSGLHRPPITRQASLGFVHFVCWIAPWSHLWPTIRIFDGGPLQSRVHRKTKTRVR